MDVINNIYDLKIEVLTPLSIGAGTEKDWVRGVDFVVKDGLLYKLNLKKIVKEGVDINQLTSYFASKNEKEIVSLITERKLKKVSDCVIKLPADSPNDIKDDIKAFVKNQLSGKPILSGSSLKGAIRSILFDYLRNEESDEKQVFGSSVKGDEFMRFIKISDAEFDGTSLVNTKIFNLQKKVNWVGGWKHGGNKTNDMYKPNGFNTVYECLNPNQNGFASIMLSLSQFDKVDKHLFKEEKRDILENDLTFLFGIINKHTEDYLNKEKAFFEKYSADKTDLIIKSIDDLLSLIPSDNSYCLLKMSAGSGFHSITGDWQFDDYSIDSIVLKKSGKGTDKSFGYDVYCKKSKSAKSRKIAVWGKDHFDLMGFVKLSAQVRLDQEQRKKEDDFAHYYKLAEEASSTEQWSEVLQYIESAERIFPERLFRFDSLREFANANILLQKKQDAIEEAKRKEEEERRIANNVPLVEKIAGTSKIPTLCGNVRQWMKQNQLSVLSDDDMVVLKNKIWSIYDSLKPRDKQALKSFGKDLNDIIGSEIADKWFDEIVKK